MLGRREEEIEREEMERQLREAEMEEQLQMEGEEAERREELQQQLQVEGAGGVITDEQGERDLDDEIPDAEDFPPDDDDEMMEGDLDDDVPDPDASPYIYDTRREPDTDSEYDAEGETGITDDVEASNLNSSTSASGRQTRPLGGPQRNTRLRTARGSTNNTTRARASQWSEVDDEEALANAMLDEDELGELERNLDDEIPDAEGAAAERDLDDEIPPAEEEGEWQHTDTELEMEEDSEMDISAFGGGGVQTRSQARRLSGNAVAGPRRVQLVTPGEQQPGRGAGSAAARTSSGGGGRTSWLDSSNARRNLFSSAASGGTPGSADVFGPGGAARNVTPPPQSTQQMQMQIQQMQTPGMMTPGPAQSVRRGARRLNAAGARRGTENEDTLAGDLD